MPDNFIIRLRKYYLEVASVLRGEADVASVFPNKTDIGSTREKVYADFLRLHAPSKCNVFLGGFVFDNDGNESKQLDVIVTTDTAPRFDFHNRDGSGKSFSPVEGTLGVVSIKSTLNKNELKDALLGIASIPPTLPLGKRVSPVVIINNYDDWPYKVVYSTNGIEGKTLLRHLYEFYDEHPEIPVSRRPNCIHVAGKYVFIRVDRKISQPKQSGEEQDIKRDTFIMVPTSPDILGIGLVLRGLHNNALASTNIFFSYDDLFNKVALLP